MNNSNCVFVLFVSVYGYMCSIYCDYHPCFILVLNLLSSINCHCNQFLQHQPFVVIHLRPELLEHYFGSYSKQLVPHRSRGRRSKQLGHIEVAEECHIKVVVEEVTKCDT